MVPTAGMGEVLPMAGKRVGIGEEFDVELMGDGKYDDGTATCRSGGQGR